MQQKALANILVILVTCFSLYSCKTVALADISKKYSKEQLVEDFTILQGALQANHPSLYWYTTKDSVDAAFNSVLNSLNDSMTEFDFKNKVSWAVAKTRCGHTAVRFSKKYSKAIEKVRPPIFPLAIKTWDDSLVVLSSAFTGDSVFKRGTIILSIDKHSPKQILDSIFQFINTDGYNNNFKSQVTSFNFGLNYQTAFGQDSMHLIQFLDSNKQVRTVWIRNFQPVKDTGKRQSPTQAIIPTKKQIREARRLNRRSMTIDTALSTAYIRVATFSSVRLKKFFRQSFNTIRKNKIENVVFDLRENGGGNILSSTKLSQYLVQKPFKVGDTVAAISRSFKYGKYINPSWIFKIGMFFTSRRKREDGRYHFRYFEKHYYSPVKKNHFDGHIYLIQGGYSFSATTLFIHTLKHQSNVTIVGEETGGGSYGNSAVHLLHIVLPNTKIRIMLPVYRLVMDASQPKTGRGIFPEIEVKPNSAAIKQGIDLKIETVKELIRKSRK
jgi:hypothetical protein